MSSIGEQQFHQGIALVFNSWTALRLAVDMQWGGADSKSKRDWFVDVVSEYFSKHGKEADVDVLENILEQVMSDEFNTLLEDNSAFQVSQNLIKIYNECMQEDYSTVENLNLKQSNAPSGTGTSRKVVPESGEEDDSEDYESSDETDDEDPVTTAGPATVPSSRKEPIIDDEGFQLVTKRRR